MKSSLVLQLTDFIVIDIALHNAKHIKKDDRFI